MTLSVTTIFQEKALFKKRSNFPCLYVTASYCCLKYAVTSLTFSSLVFGVIRGFSILKKGNRITDWPHIITQRQMPASLLMFQKFILSRLMRIIWTLSLELQTSLFSLKLVGHVISSITGRVRLSENNTDSLSRLKGNASLLNQFKLYISRSLKVLKTAKALSEYRKWQKLSNWCKHLREKLLLSKRETLIETYQLNLIRDLDQSLEQ